MMSIPQVAGALYLFTPLPERGRLAFVALLRTGNPPRGCPAVGLPRW